MRAAPLTLSILLAVGCGAPQDDSGSSLLRETREDRAQRERSRETVDRYTRAEQAWRAGDLDAAEREYLELARIDARAAEPRLRLAAIAQKRHLYGETERWLREVLALEPERIETRYAMVSVLLRQRRVDEAKAEFQGLQQYGPGNEKTELKLKGALALHAGHLDQATHIYYTLIAADRNDPAGHVGLGVVRALAGDYDGATAALETARKLAPTSFVPLYDLALVRYRTGELEEAVALGREAMKLDAYYMPIRNNLAATLLQLGRVDEARAELEAAVKTRPSYAPARNNLGVLLLSRGDHAGAEKELREAVHHAPRVAALRFNLGIVRFRQGDAKGARAEFEQVLKLDPRNADAPRNLRWLDGLAAGTAAGGDLPSPKSQYSVDEFHE